MTQILTNEKRVLAAVLWIAALGVATSLVAAADSPFVGNQSCSSLSCHGRSEPRRTSSGNGGASLQEFVLYARHDPHAAAAKRLVSPEFQAMVRRMSERKDGPSTAEVYRQCAQCHDPEGVAVAEQSNEPLLPPEVGHGTSSRGIDCESCHGGAKDWLATHYQRDVIRSSLAAAGMRDTKNLKVRAELCASCHVGSAERNVDHDLLAAGHPPLRFELAAYHRKLTNHDDTGKQSHWNDARERIGTKDFEVKLWEAGQLASANAALALLESRAHRAAFEAQENRDSGVAPWPEFAEYDCFSCHQRLRPVQDNRKSPAAGLPEWEKWNLSLIAIAGDTKELNALRVEMKKSFAAEPAVVKVLAGAAKKSLVPSLFSDEATSGLLLNLSARPPADNKSWDSLCQRYLAQRVAQKSIGDEFQKLELASKGTAAERTEFDALRQRIDRDLGAIAHELSFAGTSREWPRLLADGEGRTDGFAKVESDLTATAGKLRELHSYVEQRR